MGGATIQSGPLVHRQSSFLGLAITKALGSTQYSPIECVSTSTVTMTMTMTTLTEDVSNKLSVL